MYLFYENNLFEIEETQNAIEHVWILFRDYSNN